MEWKCGQAFESGLKDRLADLHTILEWAAHGLDVFVRQSPVITTSLDTDMKIAVMKALSSYPTDLENTEYVEKLKKGFQKNPSSSKINNYVKKLEKSRRKNPSPAIEKASNIIDDARKEYISHVINPIRKKYILRQGSCCSIM